MERTKEKKIIPHPFLNRYTLIGAILLTVYALLIGVSIVGGVIGMSLALAFSNPALRSFGSVAAALLVLAIHKRWFYPEFEGNLRGGRPGLGFKLGLFVLILWCTAPFDILAASEDYGPLSFGNFALALMAGVCEETAFRGLPLSYLMRQWKDEKKIPVALLLSAVLFGLAHGGNLFAGADPGITLLQVGGTMAIGVFLGAVYLRSGNLWPVIVIHTLNDVLAFLNTADISGGVMVADVTPRDLRDLMLSVVLAGVGLWLIRPSKRAEILDLWREKWRPLPETLYSDIGGEF